MLNLRFLLTSLLFALFCFPVIAWAWFDHLNAGDGWRQGDWLVNFGDGPIRRGLIGEALIWFSDTSGLDLLLTTQAAQVLIYVATVFVLWCIALRHHDPLIIAILGLSSLCFVTFFAANPMGSMRKEIFSVLAMALVCLCSLLRRPPLILPVLALVMFVVGCIGNVLNALMLPAFLGGLYLLFQQDRISRPQLIALAGGAAFMATFWIGFAMLFKEVSDHAAICAPLLERGIRQEVCDHAIRWLVAGAVDHNSQVVARMTAGNLATYALVALIGLWPLVVLLQMVGQKKVLALFALICFVPLLPLYASATDWGRWLSLSYTATALLLVQAQSLGLIKITSYPRPILLACLGGASLSMAPEHSLGWNPGGALREVVQTILVFA